MNKSILINAIFLVPLNTIFMIAGIFLNSMVIISFRRSSQLRKKLCFFMILVLSYIDLTVVVITHPLHIFSTILIIFGNKNKTLDLARQIVLFVSYAFSTQALLILNIERYLALSYPFFHHTCVTRKRLVLLLGILLLVLFIGPLALVIMELKKALRLMMMTYLLFHLLLLMFLNYKMFLIAK